MDGLAGGVWCSTVPVDGRGSSGDGADAQSELRRQERVRDDPELQGSAGRFQQAQDLQGPPWVSLYIFLISFSYQPFYAFFSAIMITVIMYFLDFIYNLTC